MGCLAVWGIDARFWRAFIEADSHKTVWILPEVGRVVNNILRGCLGLGLGEAHNTHSTMCLSGEGRLSSQHLPSTKDDREKSLKVSNPIRVGSVWLSKIDGKTMCEVIESKCFGRFEVKKVGRGIFGSTTSMQLRDNFMEVDRAAIDKLSLRGGGVHNSQPC